MKLRVAEHGFVHNVNVHEDPAQPHEALHQAVVSSTVARQTPSV